MNRKGNPKHGHCPKRSKSPEYIAWSSAKQRCENPRQRFYALYGGRGIRVCQRWQDFANFLADMGPHPGKGYSLDRLDNERGYEPGNCRWATSQQQRLNQRTRVTLLTIEGRTECVDEWARIAGVGHTTIRHRLARGWSARDAVFAPLKALAQDARNTHRRLVAKEKRHA